MSRVGVYTEAPAGGDRVWLDLIAEIQGLHYATTYPGGDSTATWQMWHDPRGQHRGYSPGRKVGLSLGSKTLWNGALDNPSRGDVWQCQAIGRAADTKRYLAYAPTSGDALDLNEVLTNAISRGLAFSNPGGLPSLAASSVPSATITVDDAFDQVTTAQATPQYWNLSESGVLTVAAAPTTAQYVLIATGPGGGRTTDNFVTDVYVTYQSASGVISTVVRSNTAARSKFGRFEAPLDLTGLGLIPDSQANDAGDAYLARNAPRAKFTSTFTATRGQLQTMGGAAVDLATVRAGCLVNVIVTDPDSAGDVTQGGPVQVLMGGTDYDVDADTLTLTPFDSAQDSLTELLTA